MKKSQSRVLNNIPFVINIEKLFLELKLDNSSEYSKELFELVQLAAPLLKPKAIFKVGNIESRNGDVVKIDGVDFSGHVLKTNLEKVEKVFPFIATCGNELENLGIRQDDFLKKFWIDSIKEQALHACVDHLKEMIKKNYGLNRLPSMSPGSGGNNVWQIEQQKPLFSLFGNVEQEIGVKLTDSYLMIPNKSVSGIYFAGDIDFISCRLCDREDCRERKAFYNKNLNENLIRK